MPTVTTTRHHRYALSTPLVVALLSIGGFWGILRYDTLYLRNEETQTTINVSHNDDDVLVDSIVEDKPIPVSDINLGETVTYKTISGHKISYTKQNMLSVKEKVQAGAPFIPVYPQRKAPTPKIGNRTIYFLHIHKSGGSSMCSLAKKNRMTANYRRNCNVQADQHCCGDADTFEAQHTFATTTTFSFVSSESYMYKAMDHQGFYYALILRNSSERYMSHYQHVARSSTKLHFVHPGTFEMWWTHQPDNWSVRMICGSDCANTPKYQITREQWEETLSRLRSFDSIMFLENFTTSFLRFANNVGWPIGTVSSQNRKNVATYEREQIQMAPFMTVLDDALYQYARQLMSDAGDLGNTTGFPIESYFEQGSLQRCTSPCCGNCSQYRL